MVKRNKSDLERFEDKYIPVTESGCWIWTGAGKDRYGSFHLPNYPKPFSKNMISAHKAALYLYKNIVPEQNEVVLHKCDNGFCCNPDHLVLGSQYENMQDMRKKKRYKIPTQKMTNEDAEKAVRLRESGISVREIAKIFNMSESQMSRITRNLTHN